MFLCLNLPGAITLACVKPLIVSLWLPVAAAPCYVHENILPLQYAILFISLVCGCGEVAASKP